MRSMTLPNFYPKTERKSVSDALQFVGGFDVGGQFRDGRIFEQALHQRGVHGVSGAFGDYAAEHLPPDQGKVTNQIEYLVAYEFVLEA